ncbi:MAG: hypothetical protein QF415_17160 [Candidatus Undinarchaeales archaeon]|nr:hypothetical protein [Candidatus Undinarchaeales archaeon]MDP7493798.1 hypothetical protein [Candidatus Undinarchaeales archaeon]
MGQYTVITLVFVLLLVPAIPFDAVNVVLDPSAYSICAGESVTLNLTIENPTNDQQLYVFEVVDETFGSVFEAPDPEKRSLGRGMSMSTDLNVRVRPDAPVGTHTLVVRASLSIDPNQASTTEGSITIKECEGSTGIKADRDSSKKTGLPVPLVAGVVLIFPLLAVVILIASRMHPPEPEPVPVVQMTGQVQDYNAYGYAMPGYYANYQYPGGSYYYNRYGQIQQ